METYNYNGLVLHMSGKMYILWMPFVEAHG